MSGNSAEAKGYVDQAYLQKTAELLQVLKTRSYERMHIKRGHSLLDVGCGPGTDTIPLWRATGRTGNIAGVDVDASMIAAANKRALDVGCSSQVRHQQSEAASLPFPAEIFDASRSERLFQHLADPAQALEEMVRVTKSPGWIVAADTDWGTLSVDMPDTDLERRITRVLAEHTLHNGYAGRQLLRLFRQQKLRNVSVEMFPICLTDYASARQLGRFDDIERHASDHGISRGELSRWHRILEEADTRETFFATVMIVLVAGSKP